MINYPPEGTALVFVAYNQDELRVGQSPWGDEDNYQPPFKPGDKLIVLPDKSELGISVSRESDGHVDMVFPEEVKPFGEPS